MSDEIEEKIEEKPAAVRAAEVPVSPAAPKKPDLWDAAAVWLESHGALPALAVLTIAVLGIHIGVFRGETAGDDLSFHFAESARLADCLRHFDFDFWNPSANAGYASAYYYQVIPQMVSAVPTAIFGHHLFWFQLSVVLPLVLAPAAAYRGMRLLGATPWQAVAASFCVAFMNGESRWGSGNAGTFVVGLYTQTWALCAFPLALGHAKRWITDQTDLPSAIGWGAFATLCHPFAGLSLGFTVLFGTLALIIPELVRDRTKEMLWQVVRGAILAAGLGIASLPVVLPLIIDRGGFGGFPHRVNDEVGPGFAVLWQWYRKGMLLDWMPMNTGLRIALLTWSLPVIMIFARGKQFRWLWTPAIVFAVLLGLGPKLGKIGDDLIPPVRFLGAMQTLFAMGIGCGVIVVGKRLWELAGRWPHQAYGIRTGLSAALAAAIVLVAVPGGKALNARVRVLSDYGNNERDAMMQIGAFLAKQPQGRKQVGPGAENHWWNLLNYVYDRVPSLLQMGGGGLQASPNYDFLWSQRDYVKNAWIYDAPYLVFKSPNDKMPVGETLLKTGNYEVRKLPSAGIVSPVEVVGVLPPGYKNDQPGHKAAIDWIRGELPMKDQVLAYQGSGDRGPPPAGKTIKAWWQDSPGDEADVVAQVEATAPTTFMARMSWHPRWHIYIDGAEARVRRVTPDFPAVDVPAGRHTIEFRFERPWWAQAVWLLWPGCIVAAFLALRRLAKRKEPQLPEARTL